MVVQTANGLQGERFEDGVVRVRDVDVAELLGYERPRKVRELIERNMAFLSGISMRPTVGRIEKRVGNKVIGHEDRAVNEYWLTEVNALYIAAKSDTDLARAGTLKLIQEFIALKELVAERANKVSTILGLAPGLAKFLLRPKAAEWRECFTEDFVRSICRLYGQPYVGRRDEKGQAIRDPRFLGNIQKMIYEYVCGKEAYRALKNRADDEGVRLHQILQEDPNTYFRLQLDVVQGFADMAADQSGLSVEGRVDIFWSRMRRQYRGAPLQIVLAGTA